MGVRSAAVAGVLAVIMAPVSTASAAAAPGAMVARPDPGNGDPDHRSQIPGSFPAEEAEVRELSNQERRKNGCNNDLREDAALTTAARGHSQNMAASGTLSHEGAQGSQPDDRMEDAGYDTSSGWGENIASGQKTPEAVMKSWMNSAPHRKNILNCKFEALGVGVAQKAEGSLYWTQNFGGK